jgi:cardiolipin synthase
MAMNSNPFFTNAKFKVGLTSMGGISLLALIIVNFSLGDTKVQQELPRLHSIEDAQFQRSLGVMLGLQIVEGNRFAALLNGDQIFPEMLEAIRGAQKTIVFESYIYWSGEITLAQWQKRPLSEKILERSVAVLGLLL